MALTVAMGFTGGDAGVLRIEGMGYFDPDIVTFYGSDPVGGKTQLVGSRLPNPFGLYDMHGNVNEWCSDYYGSYPGTPATDPIGPATGSTRVFRGGGWTGTAGFSRAAFRTFAVPTAASSGVGFRVVRQDSE